MTNFIRKLEKIIKPIVLVAAFIIVLSIGFCNEAKADVSIELGAPYLSGQYSEGGAIILTERFDKYSIGIGYISEQWVVPRREPRTWIRENLMIQGLRHVNIGKFELGIGVAYFNATNRALGANLNAAMLIRYNFSDKFSFNIRHYSNAGSSPPNMGQDLLTIGYIF